jgi:Ala-tRNA(Pro) deacylase
MIPTTYGMARQRHGEHACFTRTWEATMAIAASLKGYLDSHGVAYDVVTHERATSMLEAAQAAGLAGGCVAKTVVLEDDDGYMLAVVPASQHIRMGALRRVLNRRAGLATEAEFADLFGDCEPGAVPPVGAVYGLEVIVDDSLIGQPELYFEAGDHRTLIHVGHDAFERLMAGAMHGRITAASMKTSDDMTRAGDMA